jgi:hypothetical protein
MEAAKGTQQTINYATIAKCGECSGSGLKKGAKKSTCRTCGGTGEVSNGNIMVLGFADDDETYSRVLANIYSWWIPHVNNLLNMWRFGIVHSTRISMQAL